jgi:hypothetical protein
VRLQNQLESLLEEAHFKLSSLVSDLLGASARRMLKALADGETNPAALAALADERLRATPEQLCDALSACTDLKPVYRRLLKMALDQLQFLDDPTTPKSRLSDRTTESSTPQSTRAVIFDPALSDARNHEKVKMLAVAAAYLLRMVLLWLSHRREDLSHQRFETVGWHTALRYRHPIDPFMTIFTVYAIARLWSTFTAPPDRDLALEESSRRES